MLTINDMDADQLKAADVLFEQDYTLLVSAMGGGKTIVALTAIEELIAYTAGFKCLVVAPLKVCDAVWASEYLNWEHTHAMRIGIATEADRNSVFKDVDRYDVIVTNFESLSWMKEMGLFKHFNGLLIDESTKMKSHGTWFKSIRREIKNFDWRCCMTGTPVSENWQQLFYQMFIVDGGETFGRNHQLFIQKWFYALDFKGYRWEPHDHSPRVLMQMINPFTHVMPDYRDSLPPLYIKHHPAPLPLGAMRAYKDMANLMRVKDLAGEEVTADTAAIKSMKLRQIANGFLYPNDKRKPPIWVHDAKTEILENLVEKLGKQGVGNILIVYEFVEELRRLRDAFPKIVSISDRPIEEIQESWNAGRIPLMCLQVGSGSHGLNLQGGGHTLIMLAPCWSRDKYDQVRARIWRRGQRHAVTAHIIEALNTIDDQVIIPRLAGKGEIMPLFIQHLAELSKSKAPD